MRAVKDMVSSMENSIKTRSRRGYQAVTRSFIELQRRIEAGAERIIRKSPRSKGGKR